MKVTFVKHLDELRNRLIKVLTSLFLTTILSYPLSKILLYKITLDLLPGVRLIVLSPQEAIFTYIKVSLMMGFTLSLPVITYQTWMFLAPGLKTKEKKIIGLIIIPSMIMFILGVSFGYLFFLPVSLEFLVDSAIPLATPMLSLDNTVSFILSILLSLGIVFQLPVITAALTKFQVITPKTLAEHRKHAIVLVFLISAILTDPSVITQVLLAVPLVFLYEVGIFTSKMMV